MPKIKMKTRRAAAKRFSVTGSGKVKYKQQGTRHILTKKSTKRKRQLRGTSILCAAEEKRAKLMMPYA
jgi:large subunit ribosomal protein L35